MRKLLPATSLVWSTLCAQSSEQIALATGPLVVVLVLGGGAAETGLLQTVQTLPFLLLALPVGVLVDRGQRRTIMLAAEALRSATLLTIVLALVSGSLSTPLLALLGFLGAVGTLTFNVASPALLPSIVPPSDLPGMNRWLELARSVAFVAGPPLGGALVGWTGAPQAYVVAMTASLASLALLFRIVEPHRRPAPRRHPWHEVVEGFHFVLNHTLLLPIAATAMVFNIGWFILQAVFVVYLIEHLHAQPGIVGPLFGLYGVGMIVGAMLSAPLARRFTLGKLIAIGPLGGFAGSLLIATTLFAPSLVPVGIGLFCFGFGPILWTINTTSLRQVVTPAPMLGRVSALMTLATAGATPLGAAIGLLLATSMGINACLIASSLCFLGQFLIILLTAPSRLIGLPRSPIGEE